MELKIQSLHFNASEKLHEFIEKKVAKLEKICEQISRVDVVLKVVKPETANNKEASIQIVLPGNNLHVEKVSGSFEESVDECVDVLKRQLEKYKEKHREK